MNLIEQILREATGNIFNFESIKNSKQFKQEIQKFVDFLKRKDNSIKLITSNGHPQINYIFNFYEHNGGPDFIPNVRYYNGKNKYGETIIKTNISYQELLKHYKIAETVSIKEDGQKETNKIKKVKKSFKTPLPLDLLKAIEHWKDQNDERFENECIPVFLKYKKLLNNNKVPKIIYRGTVVANEESSEASWTTDFKVAQKFAEDFSTEDNNKAFVYCLVPKAENIIINLSAIEDWIEFSVDYWTKKGEDFWEDVFLQESEVIYLQPNLTPKYIKAIYNVDKGTWKIK